jgi:NADH dehydrogenase
MQGSLHAANTVRRRLRDDHRDVQFKYRDLGSAAAIGRFKAIVSVHGLRLSGFPGWVVWLFVHIGFLNGFGNRIGALWRWTWVMIGSARPERVFSVGHTGGDISMPTAVREKVRLSRFPVIDALDEGALPTSGPPSAQ